MHHHKFNEVCAIVDANIPVLLTGEKGSGKTTLAKQVSEHLNLNFYSISMTRQTTLSHLLGFNNVNGIYIPSQLREVVENGGIFLLDEIDAGDANVLLCLNTIENGFVSFPDGIVELHPDFRLMATSNPQSEHHHYTGRTKLDAATLDRFDIIDMDRDDDLEKYLVDHDVFSHITIIRKILASHNSSISISMRDTLRFQKRKNLDLLEGFVHRLLDKNPMFIEKYHEEIKNIPKFIDQKDCLTLQDLIQLMNSEKRSKPFPSPPPDANREAD